MDLVSANFSYKPFYLKNKKQAIQQSRTACFFDLIYELNRRPFAKTRLTSLLIGVQQLDIVKFALPLRKSPFIRFSQWKVSTRISSCLTKLLHDLNFTFLAHLLVLLVRLGVVRRLAWLLLDNLL